MGAGGATVATVQIRGGPVAPQHAADEQYLAQAAQDALGGEEVLGAGIFELKDAYLYGTMAGGAVGGALTGGLAHHHGAAGGAVAMAGDYAAMKEGQKLVAQSAGMTFDLLVAVTASRIVVLDWEGDTAGKVARSYERATTEVHAKKLGLGFNLDLIPNDDSPGIKLTGSISHGFKQSGPDKVVVHLLTEP